VVRTINVPEVKARPGLGRGFNCLILYTEALQGQLKELYGRTGLCLKVFKRKRQIRENEQQVWGPKPACLLTDCARVQNLYAMEGLVPRVYDIVSTNGYPAFVTDLVRGERGKIDRARQRTCLEMVDALGLYPACKKTFRHEPNWINGLFVDFGSCCWRPKAKVAYRKQLTRRALQSNGRKQVYQPVPELGIREARRDLAHRLEVMQLAPDSFQKKTVLDLGCSLGAFTRYALKAGATRATGLDDTNAPLAQEIANWLKFWNADFIPAKLPVDNAWLKTATGLAKFDVVFALAIVKWSGGNTKWVADLVAPGGVAYLESHGRGAAELQDMGQHFSKVERLGLTKDLGTRKVFKCQR